MRTQSPTNGPRIREEGIWVSPSLVPRLMDGAWEQGWMSPYLNASTGRAPCYWSTLQEGWNLLPWAAQPWCLQIDQFHDQVCEQNKSQGMQTYRDCEGVRGWEQTESVFAPQVQTQLLPPSLPLQHSLQTENKKKEKKESLFWVFTSHGKNSYWTLHDHRDCENECKSSEKSFWLTTLWPRD